MSSANISDTINSEAITSTATEVISTTQYDSLSKVQKQRADYLKKMIGDHAVTLVSYIDSRGRNSWPVVYEKVMAINLASFNDQRYIAAIYENFEVEVVYTSTEIIGIIGEIRQDLGMVPYLTNTKNNCELDLFKLFIVKEVYEEVTTSGNTRPSRKFIGYKPVMTIREETN